MAEIGKNEPHSNSHLCLVWAMGFITIAVIVGVTSKSQIFQNQSFSHPAIRIGWLLVTEFLGIELWPGNKYVWSWNIDQAHLAFYCSEYTFTGGWGSVAGLIKWK